MLQSDVPSAAAILDDPSASDWLKLALRSALSRDVVDAANDAMLLANVLDARAAIVLIQTSTTIEAIQTEPAIAWGSVINFTDGTHA